MPSNSKQQKRAKRAAAKAKHNRMIRNGTRPRRDNLSGPSVSDLIISGFDSGHYQNLFQQMKEAEETSLAQLLAVFFDDTLTQAAETSYPHTYAFYIQHILCEYHQWRHDSTNDDAMDWYMRDEIQDALTDIPDIHLTHPQPNKD